MVPAELGNRTQRAEAVSLASALTSGKTLGSSVLFGVMSGDRDRLRQRTREAPQRSLTC